MVNFTQRCELFFGDFLRKCGNRTLRTFAESPPTQRCELIFGIFLRKFYYRTFFRAFLVESSEIELLGKIEPRQKIFVQKCAIPRLNTEHEGTRGTLRGVPGSSGELQETRGAPWSSVKVKELRGFQRSSGSYGELRGVHGNSGEFCGA